ncbi:glycosyl transferase [Agrobacterium sp. SOY23]|uniref:O-linked N-acetylglucosamine transferase, SPINDLY family protein n=1 Tax=Agrobacterium sp. SOY23 TaxID=3014555 RepID=UPI0022AF6BA8|nr:glycosyl transferase [Agrobacterium sp. SOY23]MCZ4432898.1 glycosyl transferase [Agrobacterium sp. SOY23]
MTANHATPSNDATAPSALYLAQNQLLSLMDLLRLTEALSAVGQKAAAVELYKTWVAFNDNNPTVHLAYFNYAVALNQLGDRAGAIQAFRACLKANPQFAPGHINLGRVLEDAGFIGQAVEQWALCAETMQHIDAEAIGHRHMILQNIGRVLETAGKLEEAETTLLQAFELRPELPEAGQHWASLRQRQCKWPVLTPSGHLTSRKMLDAMSSLTISCYADDPMFQLAKAYRYSKTLIGAPPDLTRFPRRLSKKKSGTDQPLRVGYLSSDLRDHAVGFALCEVLELHDKNSLEVFAYYCGNVRSTDNTQERIKAAVHCWRDIHGMDDATAASQIISDEIDILIDVNGYTKDARAKIFAYRPAPVIVSFCGYPGSMGSPFHHYLISDGYMIPPENEIYYSEKVLRIACDQPLDRKRPIATRPSRAEVGLPEDAFVYASFNGMQKITENCFARWMTILSQTPGSLLWLLTGDEDVNQRLRDIAEKSGVAAERLVFAPKVPNPQHIARIGVADLFLDTFPYGAHSTAADAITSGLPVLTMSGKTFAARFCGSIVTAAGVPEMLCSSPEDYVARAIGFERDRKSLSEVRDAIARQRDTSVLRDIPALARRLEELFWQMQGECERGETPVPDLCNLDLYYEIGAEAVLENIEFEDEQAYRTRYLKKLREQHDYAPIPYDRRLWQKPNS